MEDTNWKTRVIFDLHYVTKIFYDENPKYRIYPITEIAVLKRISPHPNICGLVSHEFREGQYYLKLDRKIPLNTSLRYLNRSQKVGICWDICQALIHLKRHNIIHGDLKVHNIVITREEGRCDAQLIDFDFALVNQDIVNWRTRCYTQPYTPPETLKKNKVTLASDVWAAGLTFYKILTGSFIYFDNGDSNLQNSIYRSIGCCNPDNIKYIFATNQQPWDITQLTHHHNDTFAELKPMFDLNYKTRITIEEVQELPMFKRESGCYQINNQITISRGSSFKFIANRQGIIEDILGHFPKENISLSTFFRIVSLVEKLNDRSEDKIKACIEIAFILNFKDSRTNVDQLLINKVLEEINFEIFDLTICDYICNQKEINEKGVGYLMVVIVASNTLMTKYSIKQLIEKSSHCLDLPDHKDDEIYKECLIVLKSSKQLRQFYVSPGRLEKFCEDHDIIDP